MAPKIKKPIARNAPSKRKRIGFRFLLAVFGVFVALLIGEFGVRVFEKAPEIKPIELSSEDCVYRRSSNPILGFELKANFHHPQPDFIQTYERTNSHGQRDRERTLEKPKGVRRILLLGDSVVEGHGLHEDATLSSQMERLYAEGDTEVLNFGLSAYCTLAEIELLEVKGLRFDPDLVILVFVENDFDDFNREAFALNVGIDRPGWAKTLFKRSHLFRMASLDFNWFQFAAEMDPVAWNQEAIGDNNVVQGFKRFRRLADDHGFQPLVAIWPRFYDKRIANVPVLPEYPDVPVAEALASVFKLPVVRLSDFFERHLASLNDGANPRLHYTLGDELHPSREGVRVAADALREVVAEMKGGHPPRSNFSNEVTLGELRRFIETLSVETPNYARVYHRTGVEHLKAGRLDEAIREFERALEEDSNHAGAWNNMGVAYERHWNLKQAQMCYESAAKIQRNFAQARFNLARVLIAQTKGETAITELTAVLKIEPDHVEALNLLGMELGKQKDFEQAKHYLEQAIQLNPNFSDAHHNLGVVHAAEGRMKEAFKQFETAARLDPTNEAAKDHLQKVRTILNRP